MTTTGRAEWRLDNEEQDSSPGNDVEVPAPDPRSCVS